VEVRIYSTLRQRTTKLENVASKSQS